MSAPGRGSPRTSLTRSLRIMLGAGLLVSATTIGGSGVEARTQGCKIISHKNPPRNVLTCPDGLTLTAEKDTAYRLLDRDEDGKPEGAELTGHGLLVESDHGSQKEGFQILTPYAIASVRGTVWAVDVQPGRTSVFVSRGTVSVTPGGDAKSVQLQAGDGVDVEPGRALAVKRWPAKRVAQLLARFGH